MAEARHDPFGLCGAVIDGKYEVRSLIGEGGFGVVYRGVHKGFEAPVAIKCLKLPPHLDAEAQDELLSKLREEGRLLMKLSQRSAAIVQAHDLGSFTTPTGLRVPYLVLEWLEGRSLGEELRARQLAGEGGLAPVEALALLAPAAEALAIAHAENIAHRDIKPENLFLVETGSATTLKVLDFGIAKVLAIAPTVDDTSTAGQPQMFTPGYCAPEQLDRRLGATGPWTDVFALALIFVEVVVGRRAIITESYLELAEQLLDHKRRPTLRGCGCEASDELEQVLRRALCVEPGDRYADAAELLEALQTAVDAGGPVRSSDRGAPLEAPSSGVEAMLGTAEYANAQGLVVTTEEEGSAATVAVEDSASLASVEPVGAESAESTDETASSERDDPVDEPSPEELEASTGGTGSGPADARRSAAGQSRLLRRALLAVVCLAALALLVQHQLSRRAPPGPPASSGASPSASREPVSDDAEVAALYREALEAWRGGAPDAAVRTMMKAARRDRDLAAGQLRLVLWKMSLRPVEAREHYDVALRHRKKLDEKDGALLDAIEPLVRVPWDLAALDKRLTALAERHRSDAELWTFVAAARLKRGDLEKALEALGRVLTLDKQAVGAWVLKGSVLARKGDRKGQVEAYSSCLKHVPRAEECVRKQLVVRARSGDCIGMLEATRSLVALQPRASRPHRQLARALYATGAARAAINEAFSRAWSLRNDRDRETVELGDKLTLAAVDGDFARAAELLERSRKAVADRTQQKAHAALALDLAEVHLESGRPAAADAVVKDFLLRMTAWTPPVEGDASLDALAYRLRAGTVTLAEFERARAAWRVQLAGQWKKAGKKMGATFDWFVWASAYGGLLETAEQAKAALAAMPARQTPALRAGANPWMDLRIGKCQALAGKSRQAIVPLRRLARSCDVLAHPMLVVQAHYFLGLALEQTANLEGARKAYETVMKYWGKARPRSLTAEKARARLAALR